MFKKFVLLAALALSASAFANTSEDIFIDANTDAFQEDFATVTTTLVERDGLIFNEVSQCRLHVSAEFTYELRNGEQSASLRLSDDVYSDASTQFAKVGDSFVFNMQSSQNVSYNPCSKYSKLVNLDIVELSSRERRYTTYIMNTVTVTPIYEEGSDNVAALALRVSGAGWEKSFTATNR